MNQKIGHLLTQAVAAGSFDACIVQWQWSGNAGFNNVHGVAMYTSIVGYTVCNWFGWFCIVCWGVIVVPSCPLEGDTCPYNHKLSSWPSATNANTPLTLKCCTVLPFCERDMAPLVSNLMAPWKQWKCSVFRIHGVQFDAAPKDKIAAARNKWILGANYSIRAVRPNSGQQRY